MVVKMMKWSPWPAMLTRKYKVKVKPVKLEFARCPAEDSHDDHDDNKNQKVVAIKLKWRGEPTKFGIGLVPFNLATNNKHRTDFSKEKIVSKLTTIEWEEEEDDDDDDVDQFENICNFTIVSTTSSQDGHEKFGSWDVSFSVLYGDKKKTEIRSKKSKLVVIGRASLDIAEMAGKMKSDPHHHHHHQQVETKLAINLQLGGVPTQANLLVRVEFVEIRDLQVPNSVESSGQVLNESSDRSIEIESSSSSSSFDKQNAAETLLESPSSSSKKMGFFSWKKRRLSFKPLTTSIIKEEPFDKNSASALINDNKIDAQPQMQCSVSSSVDRVIASSPQVEDEGAWETKDVTSRDGQTKLKTSVFFASFDQCSNKAEGESACTALVAVIAHWLQLNRDAMPARPEFDNLILQGSSEWRKLCDNVAYTNDFPNKHFDLETVLHADIRPIAISRDDSFVGFFSPEKFESLKEAMSFDEIWNGINRIAQDHDDPRIYIVSWNDHFFVLKAEANAYYIIDTLGERLFEGCNQAYIMRFDDSSLMHAKSVNEEVNKDEISRTNNDNPCEDNMEIVCSGKECCKEFIKRFLAAIPLVELEEEEKKGAVSYYSLHHRLQIELNFSYLLPSSLTSSPFSSSSSSSSSCSTDECTV